MRRAMLQKVDMVVLGPELVLNGNFDTDTVWIKSGGSTISGGQGIFGASGSYIRQNISGLLVVATYRISYEIISISAFTTFRFNGGGSAFNTPILPSTVGFHSVDLISNGLQSGLQFYTTSSGGANACVFDNVSVKQIL